MVRKPKKQHATPRKQDSVFPQLRWNSIPEYFENSWPLHYKKPRHKMDKNCRNNFYAFIA